MSGNVQIHLPCDTIRARDSLSQSGHVTITKCKDAAEDGKIETSAGVEMKFISFH